MLEMHQRKFTNVHTSWANCVEWFIEQKMWIYTLVFPIAAPTQFIVAAIEK